VNGDGAGGRSLTSRIIPILAAVIIHLGLLFGAVFTIKTVVNAAAERSDVMKLADIREEDPPPPSRPQPVPASSPAAEKIAETDEPVPEDHSPAGNEVELDFLPMHLVSQLPKFSEDEIRRRTIYPPIAQRSELEGTVYLEIFVDPLGMVRSVRVLKEDPPGRGFGEAAARAFTGLKGSPAQANGTAVAVRYRYPVRFTLR
jgi:protein TonB